MGIELPIGNAMENRKKTDKKKTGIMGGTFNPIHMGHLLLAQTAMEAFALDGIVFIPSGLPYMKDKAELADKAMRLQMTRLAVLGNRNFTVSPIEVEREGNTYSWETVAGLREAEPDTEFYFIVGADSLFHMEDWQYPERLFGGCIILAAVRDDKGRERMEERRVYLEEKYGARIRLLPLEKIPISSTDIRNRRKQGKSIRYMVPDPVLSYIEEHHLYL